MLRIGKNACLILSLCAASAMPAFAAKSVLLIAGPKSHGHGQHEHPAGCELLANHLNTSGLDVTADFLNEAIAGHFQVDWSVNPIWKMKDPLIAEHPVTRGAKPFEAEEEFYYHIRFRERALPLFRPLPPEDSLGEDGPRSDKPTKENDSGGFDHFNH